MYCSYKPTPDHTGFNNTQLWVSDSQWKYENDYYYLLQWWFLNYNKTRVSNSSRKMWTIVIPVSAIP